VRHVVYRKTELHYNALQVLVRLGAPERPPVSSTTQRGAPRSVEQQRLGAPERPPVSSTTQRGAPRSVEQQRLGAPERPPVSSTTQRGAPRSVEQQQPSRDTARRKLPTSLACDGNKAIAPAPHTCLALPHL
jgi:hypothetical protein